MNSETSINVVSEVKGWSYHRQPDGKDEWLTPETMIWSLSEGFNGQIFDLDPCAPTVRPYPTANKYFTIEDDGLKQDWFGRVWCNPPYDNRMMAKWVRKCIDHNNSLLLVFARTETKFWKTIWDNADAILFLHGRMTFWEFECSKCGATISQHKPKITDCVFNNSNKAKKAQWSGGAGSALVAFGDCNVDALENAVEKQLLDGKLIYLGL